MLLLVSTVFICLNLPSYVIRVWVYVYKVSCLAQMNIYFSPHHCET
jgi:hypothetical protein